MRKMATIRKIDELRPIPDADSIECAIVGGWTVVVKKGEFTVGDLAVYAEIDSWIPTALAPFLSKGKEPREFEGIRGERLRTVKLRGQLSQGLLISLDIALPFTNSFQVGDDVSEALNIVKWEAVIPAHLSGLVKGPFPTDIPKTDQERCQNLVEEIAAAVENGARYEVTEKLDGSSMTCYLIQGEFGVCSRNLDLKETEGNSFWATARRDGVEEAMREIDPYWDFAIQGELIGPGIQGNIYKLSKTEFRVFDVYDIQNGKYLDPKDRVALITRMGLLHAPVLVGRGALYDTLGITGVPHLLQFAEGKTVVGNNLNQEREGVVFKDVNGGMSFKAISNKFLINEQ